VCSASSSCGRSQLGHQSESFCQLRLIAEKLEHHVVIVGEENGLWSQRISAEPAKTDLGACVIPFDRSSLPHLLDRFDRRCTNAWSDFQVVIASIRIRVLQIKILDRDFHSGVIGGLEGGSNKGIRFYDLYLNHTIPATTKRKLCSAGSLMGN
jgi:hypothetical protein